MLAAFAAAFSPNFETLLALRFIQGVGAASTRVIAVSMVRDRFGGRRMAETMSLIFMVFMIIPVIAPSIGQMVMLIGNWHLIFICMGVIGLAITLWAAMRLPETQHPEDRRPFTLSSIGQAFGIVLTNRMSLWYMLASMTVFGALFGFINSAQQVYVGIYGLGVWFPIVFAVVAGLMAVSSFLNSQFVMRIGMRRLSHAALIGFFLVSLIWFVWSLLDRCRWRLSSCCLPPRCSSSAGSGPTSTRWRWSRSVTSPDPPRRSRVSCRRWAAASIGALIGQSFDGTTTPLAAGYCGVAALSLVMVLIAERGKLFRAVSQSTH